MDDFAEDGSEQTLTASLSRLGANLLTDLILRRRVTDPREPVDWTWAEAMPPIVGGPDAVFPAANDPELEAARMRGAFEHPSTSSSSWSDGPSSDDGAM